MGAERARTAGFGRLELGLRQASDWYLWGPYLAERQWGTVREDYSADGEAWSYLPHDHARSRAYRWGEDGLAGFCDVEQRLCLGLALWNGRDPILKERIFGLTGGEGNHGEDVKEYWWYLDALPSHAWNRWRYHYPQRRLPLRAADRGERPARAARPGVRTARHRRVRRRPLLGRRGRLRQGLPDGPADAVRVTNAGPGRRHPARAADLWFRNTWSWDGRRRRPSWSPTADRCVAEHPFLGELERCGAGPGADDCCSATTRPTPSGCSGCRGPRYPKDGINDHVVGGAATVNPARRGSKCAAWYRLTVARRRDRGARLRLARRRARRPGPTSTTWSPPAAPRPTSSTPI